MSPRALALAAALAASFVLTPFPGPAAAATDPCGFTGTNRVRVCFSDPTVDSTRIFDSLGALVNAATPGDTIRIVMFHWRDGTLPERLAADVAAAHREGVDVRVLLDETSLGYRPVGILRDAAVPVRICADEARARDGEDDCLMVEDDFYQPGSLLPMAHTKLFLLELGGTPVIVAGSSNLTAWDYRTAWNDMVRVRGDRQLHDWLRGYFERMWTDDWSGWNTNAERDRSGDPVAPGDMPERAWVYPRHEPGDPIAGQLAKTTACHSDGDGDGDWDKRVWVAVSKWSTNARTRILDNLDRLDAAGCAVKVLISDSVAAEWRRELRRRISGDSNDWSEVRVVCKLHHKFLLLDAKYQDAYREVVITGSHIYATGSLYNSGELNLRVGGDHQFDNGVVVDYIDHFRMLFDRAPRDTC